jgi:hypothetical protein
MTSIQVCLNCLDFYQEQDFPESTGTGMFFADLLGKNLNADELFSGEHAFPRFLAALVTYLLLVG